MPCFLSPAVPDGIVSNGLPADFRFELSSGPTPFLAASAPHFAMCFFRPIPPIFPMLYDLDQTVQHLTED